MKCDPLAFLSNICRRWCNKIRVGVQRDRYHLTLVFTLEMAEQLTIQADQVNPVGHVELVTKVLFRHGNIEPKKGKGVRVLVYRNFGQFAVVQYSEK